LPTVTKAIQLAGGIRPLADIQRVQVRRLKRDGSLQEFEVNLWDLLRQGDIRQDAILQEGDTIIVPTATAMAAADATALGSASFAPGQIRVNVVGEVPTPGLVSLLPNSTLNQALLAAGGFNSRARRESIQLIRLNPDGTVSRREIEVDLNAGIHADNNPTLQNDDVVIVDRSGLAQAGDAIGNVLTPLSGVFSILDLPFRFLSIF
jgi:polysaccharide export outer membrane protein